MPHQRWWYMLFIAWQVLWIFPAATEARAAQPKRTQVGLASWYGPGFHGRQTASGERFSAHELTAAHRTLPLGTKVLVHNLETDAQVEVKITDRGPSSKPPRRIIDLSQAAAHRLGFGGHGVRRVELAVTEPAPQLTHPEEPVVYEVQVGAFRTQAQAEAALRRLQPRHPRAYIASRQGPRGLYYRVRVGPFHTRSTGTGIAKQLTREGHAVFVDAVPSREAFEQYGGLRREEHEPGT
jgi:peptidoglycan lytic transglycosylase